MKIISNIDKNYIAMEVDLCCKKLSNNIRDEVIYYYLDNIDHEGWYIQIDFNRNKKGIIAIRIAFCPFCGKKLQERI